MFVWINSPIHTHETLMPSAGYIKSCFLFQVNFCDSDPSDREKGPDKAFFMMMDWSHCAFTLFWACSASTQNPYISKLGSVFD